MIRLPRLCVRAALALSLLGLFTAGPLLAQSTAPPPTLIKHLRAELNSKDPARQERALVDVIALANCPASCVVALQSRTARPLRIENETGAGSVVDLDALVPDLLRAYRQGSADGHKLLALAALINIGNETGLEQLIAEKDAQTAPVRKATDMSLAAFYFAKYPELAEPSVRRRMLSLDDVERAEVLRLRAERRDRGR
jgi:hypothetical protein